MTQSSKWLASLMAALFGVIIILKLLGVYADYLWMCSLGQGSVFTTILGNRVVLGFVVGVVFFGWMLLNVRLARRPLPADVMLIGRRLLPEQERAQVEAYADKALLIFSIVGGVMAGLVASGRVMEWLQFTHAVPFGTPDPIFGIDTGFYVFKFAFLQYMWRTVFYSVLVAFVAAVLIHMYMETIRVVGNTVQTMPHARQHCLALLALALIIKAVGYRLDQYNLLYSVRGLMFSGPSYVDVHARLPVFYLMMGVSIVVAAVMLWQIRGRDIKIPAYSLVGLILVSLLGGSAYPALVQRLVVTPTQLDKEKDYIANNIKATNAAYGLDKVNDRQFPALRRLTWDDVKQNPQTVKNVRLWDHRPLEATYQQTQALRAYYHFADVDVDRYTVGGEYRQVMLSARQLDYARIPPPQAWVKTHLQYTHGYGLCASPVNANAEEGLPVLWVKDIPPRGVPGLEVDRGGLYYMASLHPRLIERISPEGQTEPPQVGPGTPSHGGPGEQQPPTGPPGTQPQQTQQPAAPQGPQGPQTDQGEYVIVNTRQKELDYPKATGGTAAGTDDNAYTQYSGKGGVQLSSWFVKAAFAAKFMDVNILLSQDVQPESRIQLNRLMPEMLQNVASFMMYDPDPYIVIDNGKLKWMTDAYTVSSSYPYSTRFPPLGNANYVRNSVKIVTDAYDGIPEFYVFDKTDPLVQSYQSMFPTLFKPLEQMDPVMRQHVRYPQLMMIIQAELYAQYHMKDPATFYQREDAWSIPNEIYGSSPRLMEAYYVIMKLPGEDKEEFLLMLPFTLAGREDRNMVAWMAARCDPEHYGELVVFRFPKESLSYGPMQVESRISQDGEVSQLITLWGQQGSQVIRGNLLVIPVNHSLLYVEPLYLESSQNGIPELRRVIVADGQDLALGTTLDEAIARLFGKTPKEVAIGDTGEAPTVPQPTASGVAAVKTLIDKAIGLDEQAQQMLKGGDLAGYQAKQKEIRSVLDQMKKTAP